MILIDDRIGSAELSPKIQTKSVKCHLAFADFAWVGNGQDGPVHVGVERKALKDLLNSMSTGRLSGHQLIGLLDTYDVVYLVVEGLWRPNRTTGILESPMGSRKWSPVSLGQRRFMARDVYNYLNTLQIICGCGIVRTTTQAETARWLDACYNWWNKEWTAHKSHLQWNKTSEKAQLTKPGIVARVASQFDGVGWDKARKIGQAFPTLGHFFRCTREGLLSIDGIGDKIADSVIKQIRGGNGDG